MANIFSGDGAPSNGGIVSTLQNGVRVMSELVTAIKAVFPAASGTSTSATAGSATLPANPVGFINVQLPDGTEARVPYYDA